MNWNWISWNSNIDKDFLKITIKLTRRIEKIDKKKKRYLKKKIINSLYIIEEIKIEKPIQCNVIPIFHTAKETNYNRMNNNEKVVSG